MPDNWLFIVYQLLLAVLYISYNNLGGNPFLHPFLGDLQLIFHSKVGIV